MEEGMAISRVGGGFYLPDPKPAGFSKSEPTPAPNEDSRTSRNPCIKIFN